MPPWTTGRMAQSKSLSPLVPRLIESRCQSWGGSTCCSMLATSQILYPREVCTQTTSLAGTGSREGEPLGFQPEPQIGAVSVHGIGHDESRIGSPADCARWLIRCASSGFV